MGIKTFFKSLGGAPIEESIPSNTIILQNYIGSSNDVRVPQYNPLRSQWVASGYRGYSKIQDYVMSAYPQINTVFRDCNRVTSIDFNNVMYLNNNWAYAMQFCYNLKEIYNYFASDGDITSLAYTFQSCYNLSTNVQLPSGLINLKSTFRYCTNLNYNIAIPDTVVDMNSTFMGCYQFNQNIQLPSSVKNMYNTFAECRRLNVRNITIPSSVNNMCNTFFNCYRLQNQNIIIKSKSVTNMMWCFHTNGNAVYTRNVYLYTKYSNGRATPTYSAFLSAGYGDGIYGVVLRPL